MKQEQEATRKACEVSGNDSRLGVKAKVIKRESMVFWYSVSLT